MAPILVTGGCGFIGSAVASRLAERGEDVVAFDLRTNTAFAALRNEYPRIRLVLGELTEWPQLMDVLHLHRPRAVVHCAAVVGVVNSLGSPIATMRVNVEGSLNLLAAMRFTGVRRMVNLSSEEVYGPFKAELIDETHPCFPMKPYGISKFAVEQLARDYAAEHGLSVTHVRTCWVYGPGLPRPRVPKTLIDAAVQGRPFHLTSGGEFRVDHVYVDDVADGICDVLERDELPHDVYHIATGTAPSLAEIAAIIREMVPGAELAIGPGKYAFADGVEAVRKGALDISRAKRDFGYAPRFDIRSGLEACVAVARKSR